jgi:hypothetical protein
MRFFLKGLDNAAIKNPYFFFALLGLELRAFTLSHSTSPILVKSFFKIRSLKLFAQAGFKPQSSLSLPPD